MLTLLVMLVTSQRTVVMPNGPRLTVKASAAVAVLVDPTSTWERRSAAVQTLEAASVPMPDTAQAQLLDAAQNARTSSTTCPPDAPPPRECGVEYGPCTSHRAFLLAALAASKGATTSAVQAFAVARLEDEQSNPLERALALELLAKAAHPAGERYARARLDHPRYDCQVAARSALFSYPTLTEETRDAVALALQRASLAGLELGALVATRTEPWASGLLEVALRHPSSDLRRGVVRGAATRSDPPAELRQALVRLATCDPSFAVRLEARPVLRTWRIAVPATQCPAPQWHQRGRGVEGPDGGVTLDTTSVPSGSACREVLQRTDGGAPLTPRGRLVVLGAVDSQCLVGFDRGEFGSELVRWSADAGPESVISHEDDPLNPIALVRQGDARLVISGLNHMSGFGAFGRLDVGDAGPWRYTPLVLLEGVPRAWASTDTHLFLAFDAQRGMEVCPGTRGEVVYVYGVDGSFSAAAGPGTRCLWKER
jgi:hypothetical protein